MNDLITIHPIPESNLPKLDFDNLEFGKNIEESGTMNIMFVIDGIVIVSMN